MADLTEAARRQPGTLTYGSAGSGTSIHLAGALFCADVIQGLGVVIAALGCYFLAQSLGAVA